MKKQLLLLIALITLAPSQKAQASAATNVRNIALLVSFVAGTNWADLNSVVNTTESQLKNLKNYDPQIRGEDLLKLKRRKAAIKDSQIVFFASACVALIADNLS